jgi:hypothetical protein
MQKHYCHVLVYLLIAVPAGKNDKYYVVQLKSNSYDHPKVIEVLPVTWSFPSRKMRVSLSAI